LGNIPCVLFSHPKKRKKESQKRKQMHLPLMECELLSRIFKWARVIPNVTEMLRVVRCPEGRHSPACRRRPSSATSCERGEGGSAPRVADEASRKIHEGVSRPLRKAPLLQREIRECRSLDRDLAPAMDQIPPRWSECSSLQVFEITW
jgi:hypothetical protein